jgi:hypothetical protein
VAGRGLLSSMGGLFEFSGVGLCWLRIYQLRGGSETGISRRNFV